MATSRFSGPLASEFAAFAATLEASATASKTTVTQLRALDRFTAQRGLPSGTIDETLARAWLAGCATRAPNTRARPLLPAAPLLPLPGDPPPRHVRARRVTSPAPPTAQATPHLHPRRGACPAGRRARTAGLDQPASLPDPVDHLAHAHPAAGHLRPADLRSAAPHPGRRGPGRGCSVDPPVEVPQIPARAGLRRDAGRRCAATTTCASPWPPPIRPVPSSSPVAAPATAPRPSRRYSVTSPCKPGYANPTAAVPGCTTCGRLSRSPGCCSGIATAKTSWPGCRC